MRILLLASLLLITSTSLSKAETLDPILAMPEGQVILNISATERLEVEQDLLVATLYYKAENINPAALQNDINTKMRDALNMARNTENVKVQTGSYRVYERQRARTEEKYWEGSQSLTLKSTEAQTLLDLVGNIQEMGLGMNNLSYTLSDERAVEIQDQLMEGALEELQNRADRAASALNKGSAALREVNVQSSGGSPKMYARAEMAYSMDAGAMAAPVADAGETTITLTVSARAILKP